ncbi:MAG: hypothetical protein ACI9MR_002698, partial [Myxococcota bacterium]
MSLPPLPPISALSFLTRHVPIILGVGALAACEPAPTTEAPSRTCVKTQVAPLTSETIAEETVTLNADGLPLERQRLLHRGTGEDL